MVVVARDIQLERFKDDKKDLFKWADEDKDT
jgi:hypothetical protein